MLGGIVILFLVGASLGVSAGLVLGILVAEGAQRRRIRSLYRHRFGEEAP